MDLVYKDSFVFFDILKGMYSLKKSDHVVSDHIAKLLKPHDYYPLRSNPGIWCQGMFPTKCALYVDHFGIKYTNIANTHHLDKTL